MGGRAIGDWSVTSCAILDFVDFVATLVVVFAAKVSLLGNRRDVGGSGSAAPRQDVLQRHARQFASAPWDSLAGAGTTRARHTRPRVDV